jgi:lipoprotein-anchoring transpeptidase ErfK/SrfK
MFFSSSFSIHSYSPYFTVQFSGYIINSLGTRVTYGCILLSNENIQLLYQWAEAGVVVEIKA